MPEQLERAGGISNVLQAGLVELSTSVKYLREGVEKLDAKVDRGFEHIDSKFGDSVVKFQELHIRVLLLETLVKEQGEASKRKLNWLYVVTGGMVLTLVSLVLRQMLGVN